MQRFLNNSLYFLVFKKKFYKLSFPIKSMQKKVTLSFDKKVYENFQKFCKANAIMLSKKLELEMERIIKNGVKKDE
jgi:hypothetical protein